MRGMSRITIVAAVLIAAAAWTSLASAEPWEAYSYGQRGEFWYHGPHGWSRVYLGPWYPGYGPLMVIYDAYPGYYESAVPDRVREVRLHDRGRSSRSSLTKADAAADPAQPTARMAAAPSRTRPESRVATADSPNDAPADHVAPARLVPRSDNRTDAVFQGPMEF